MSDIDTAICQTVEYVSVLKMPGIEKVLNMCEYALE